MSSHFLYGLMIVAGASLASCSPAQDTSRDDIFRDLVISKVPVRNAMAAGSYFQGCFSASDGGHTCSECQMTLHEGQDDGPMLIAYATLYEHQVRIADGEPRYTVTSELDTQTFTSDGMRGYSPQMVMSMAESWCETQTAGSAELIRIKGPDAPTGTSDHQ